MCATGECLDCSFEGPDALGMAVIRSWGRRDTGGVPTPVDEPMTEPTKVEGPISNADLMARLGAPEETGGGGLQVGEGR